MSERPYMLRDTADIETPALLYYKDIIIQNTKKTIEMAGGAHRLWPHVKSHKMREMIRLQQSMGIQRFKCATIAEAQMVAECGAAHILLAYPLVGPGIARFLALQEKYPQSRFYAIGDDEAQLEALSRQSEAAGRRTPVLLDINMGMNRTGVPIARAEALYRRAAQLPGLEMTGIHGYDGHVKEPDPTLRRQKALESTEAVHALYRRLAGDGVSCQMLVAGGTPSFPIHAAYEATYLSPGTIFLTDGRYITDLKDLPMTPAAVLLARVISHPGDGLFTLDLGSKAISTDSEGRGILLSAPGAVALFQSEEHWVFRMPPGEESPPIGTAVYVLPLHICPTTALYPFAHVVSDGQVIDRWAVTARDRNIGV